MGRRDKRRSRDRRRAKREGLPTRPVKVKWPKPERSNEPPPSLREIALMFMQAQWEAEREMLARPKLYSFERDEIVCEPWYDVGTGITYLPDGTKYVHPMT